MVEPNDTVEETLEPTSTASGMIDVGLVGPRSDRPGVIGHGSWDQTWDPGEEFSFILSDFQLECLITHVGNIRRNPTMRLLDGYWNLRIYGKRLGLTIPQQPYRILTTAVLLGHQYQAVVNDQGEEVLLCLWYKKDPKGNSVYVANWTLVTDPHVVEAVYTHLSDGSDTLWLDLQNTPIVDDYFASSRPELRIRRLPTPNIIWWMAEDPIFEDPQFSQMRLPRLVMRQDRRQASRAEVVTSPEPVVPPTRSKEDDPTSWELLVEDSVE